MSAFNLERGVPKWLQLAWRLSRPMTLGAQGVVIDEAGRLVMVRAKYRPVWHFPGGGVERGETVETALRRELAEEAGVEVSGAPELFGLYANPRFRGDHIALFLVRTWEQPKVPEPNREIVEIGRFARGELPANTSAATLRRLAEIFDAAPRSEQW